MDNIDLTDISDFGLIPIWECALNWILLELIDEPKLNICHLHDLRATYPKHVSS